MKDQLRKYKAWILAASLPVALLIVTAVPSLKSTTRDFLNPERRAILAKAQGALLNDGENIEVVKVQNRDQLVLEIYKAKASGELEKIDTIELPGNRNAHFTLSNQASNLALLDVNSDGRLDIVSAFVDSKMTPRLAAFTWNPVSQMFDPMTEIQLRVAQFNF